MSFNKLKELSRHSIEEQEFIDNYYKYMPLTYSDSTMNMLCQHIEGINFEINKKINTDDSEDFIRLYKNEQYECTKEEFDQIVSVLKRHTSSKKFEQSLSNNKHADNDYNEDEVSNFNTDSELLEYTMSKVCNNVYMVVNCLVDYFYIIKPSANKDILWGTYGRYILNNVKMNTVGFPKFPFPSTNGDISYLGKKYALKEITYEL